MKHIRALLSDGKDKLRRNFAESAKLDVFLSEYKRSSALDVKTNHFDKGDVGRRLAVILLIIAAVWFVVRLFS